MKTPREMELVERIEAYLNGSMSPEEKLAFEKMRHEDATLDQKVVQHQQFLKELTAYGNRRKLHSAMEKIHEELDVAAIKREIIPAVPLIKILWNKYRMNAAVAASVAIIAVFATMLTTGYFSKNSANNSNYSALRREINNIKKSQHALIQNIQNEPAASDQAEYGGTGFAISSNGLLVTNYHVINGAKSVFIQEKDGTSYKVKIVHTDPAYDIAVLKVDDSLFKKFGDLPYTFKKTTSDVGEDVYTYGFPKDNAVYGKGYLSSNTGYLGDSTAYQVSIDVNDGNSGSPLLDNRGNIIGIVKGKQTQSDGAAFAIKSPYLLKSLDDIPADSLDKKLVLNKKRNGLAGLNRKDQIKKLQDFVFMVKVY